VYDTGAYASIHGTFNTTASTADILLRGQDGECNNATQLAGVLIAKGSGPIFYK
jgi:hypothetical protein